MTTENTMVNPYRVRLVNANMGGGTVSFTASPTISENRNVNYNALEPLHAPGAIQVYKNTASRSFQLSDVRLISRTIEEATLNLRSLWRLRSWCMPRFGRSSTLNAEQRANRTDFEANDFELTAEERSSVFGTELLGAPPPVLYLSAYSREIGTTATTSASGAAAIWQIQQHINRVPVVINQLSIPYPNDQTYITTENGTPMPAILNIDLALLETHSPDSYEAFDLDAFRQGRLPGF